MNVSDLLKDLTKSEKLLLLKKVIGFEEEPVSIEQFYTDDYYLGKVTNNGKGIYGVWKEALNEIYPDNITTKTFVCLNGAIRTGKSNTSKIMILYDIYKYCCLGKNIYKYFELIPRPFFIGIGHQTKEKAQANVDELLEWMWQSPWFCEQFAIEGSLLNQFEIKAVRSPDDFIGRNMCCFWGTELNFMPLDRGTELINSAISRIEGTFNKGFDLFVHIILDSSDTTNDSVVPYFLQKHPFGRRAIQYKYSIFDAKPHLYYHIEDKLNIDNNKTRYKTNGVQEENPYYGLPRRTFRIYKGDSEIHPCILEPYGEPIAKSTLNKMDNDKFIDCPLELLDSAKADIELFLQEKCGQSVESTNQYFNPKYVVPHWVLPNLVHTQDSIEPADIIQVDFFGDDNFIDLMREAVYALPRDRCIFGRLDLGISGDRAGFSIGYVEDVCLKDEDGIVTYDPKIKIPISVGISRYAGQETCIEKLTDLIQWIHSIVPFYEFTTDTFQSFAIKQKLISAEINARFLSVDRTKTAYQLTKQFFYRDKLDICMNNVLKTELLNVYDTGDKIDHHDTMNDAMEIGSDSKDIADSVVGLVQSIFECLNEDAEGVMTPPVISNSQRDKINKDFIEQYLKSERIKMFTNKRFMQYGH